MDKKNCYALFIGIDYYMDSQIPDLSGCVNDAQKTLTYLQSNLNQEAYNLQVKTLLTGSEQLPTRANIIQGIRQHLGQAQSGDMALLFYAGHGSKEKAHPYFGEADGNLQTLVPYDARTETAEGHRVKNIIDKEIRYLFHDLWKDVPRKPDIIFIQDSCHATGATRKAEQLKTVTEQLLHLETQLAEEDSKAVAIKEPVARYTNPTDYEKNGNDWADLDATQLTKLYTAFDNEDQPLEQIVANLQEDSVPFDKTFPQIHHIHLAACDKHEFAYELPGEGGIFTNNLIEILEASQNTISYHDLFNRARINIGEVYEQTPDLYVNNDDFMKRHEPFLGNLLKRGKLPPYRDVDVFKGFFPVVSKGMRGWQIKAGEVELLPSLDGKIKSIPIEVFPQDQKPTGVVNAAITSVTSTSCVVEFTTANFDRRTYRNKLYAMIPPQYLRRWRVAATVETSKNESPFTSLFSEHGLVKNTKNFSNGNQALLLTDAKEKAHFIVQDIDNWYHLYDKGGNLIFQASAVRYTEKEGSSGVIKKPNDATVYKKSRKGTESILEDAYEQTPHAKDAINPIVTHLIQSFNNNPTQSLNVFFEAGAAEDNAFVQFQNDQKATLDYYLPFINWTTPEKAQYIVTTQQDGFEVYPLVNGTQGLIPAFQKTNGTKRRDGYEVILSLQKMSKWKTVINLYNKLQVQALSNHQFEFQFKLYTQAVDKIDDPNRPFTSITLQSWQEDGYSNMARGLFKPLQELQNQSIHFLHNPKYPSVFRLDMDLDMVHLQGHQQVYVSALLLDSNFAILPLQKAMGNNVLPVQTDNAGTLKLRGLEFHKPLQMKAYPKENIPSVSYYIKLFVAYKRFDISGLLQAGLPAPTPRLQEHATAGDKYRLDKRPTGEETGSWMSFTIPLTIEHEL